VFTTLEQLPTGDKYLERIHGYIHSQFSVEVESQLEMESIGQQSKVNKNLPNDKVSKIKKEQLKVKLLDNRETRTNKIEEMSR